MIGCRLAGHCVDEALLLRSATSPWADSVNIMVAQGPVLELIEQLARAADHQFASDDLRRVFYQL